MASISVRPSRYSYDLIEKTGEFVINLTTRQLVFATDYCGVKSGSEINKFEKLNLTAIPAKHVKAPLIQESPINIECRVKEIKKLGSHDMFIADVLCIHADYKYVDKKGAFDLSEADPICYSHGKYYLLGKYLGYFGYSVRKKS
jgi:flavin reductase (DIM6/NTAB) family NADH-FMN oxidoreductase RutF